MRLDNLDIKSGCIRMRNNDVVELAILLEEFANIKTLNKIKVVLI